MIRVGKIRLVSSNPLRVSVPQEPLKESHAYSIEQLRNLMNRKPVAYNELEPNRYTGTPKGLLGRIRHWFRLRKVMRSWITVFPYLDPYEVPLTDREELEYRHIDFCHSDLLKEIGNHAFMIHQLTQGKADTVIVGRDIMSKLYDNPHFMGSYKVQCMPEDGYYIESVTHTPSGDVSRRRHTLLGMKVIFLPYVEGLVVFDSSH